MEKVEKPADLLREFFAVFKLGKTKRQSTSLRAFAREVGMSYSLMDYIMNGKRALTVKRAIIVASRLNLSKTDKQRLVNSALLAIPGESLDANQFELLTRYRRSKGLPGITKIDISKYKAIHWYHFAIMDLASLKGFQSDPEWIGRRLGLTTSDVCAAIDRLVSLRLMVWEGEELKKVAAHLRCYPERSEIEVRKLHRQILKKAEDQLIKTDPESFASRSITAVTMGVKKDRLAEAMSRIDQFQNEMTEFLSEGQSDELYMLQTLFFPLTCTPLETNRNGKK